MTIGLAMIVRDEQDALPACLQSVLPLIDTWTVIDTGSEDNTCEIVHATLGHLPGALHDRLWRSHQHNRTELLQVARGTADYLLLVDADTVVTVSDVLPDLTADLYVARLAGDFQHTLPFLVEGRKAGWSYKGAAHATLICRRPIVAAELEQVRLTEQRSSQPRTDKIARDAQALEAEFDPRSIFYLAQSYRDLGYDEAAADLYRFRVRHTASHPQERFWACYQEGLLRIERDQARGVAILLEAWQMRPTRAEPLWKLARHHRINGQPHAALLFAERACQIPRTGDDHFVLAWVYDWGCLMERALARQACGQDATDDFTELAAVEGEPGEFARSQLEQRRAA